VGCVALLLTHGYGRQLRFAREHIEPLRGSPTTFVCTHRHHIPLNLVVTIFDVQKQSVNPSPPEAGLETCDTPAPSAAGRGGRPATPGLVFPMNDIRASGDDFWPKRKNYCHFW
jgi:hypothetical protein